MQRYDSFEEKDERAALVNLTCKLIVRKYNGNMERAVSKLDNFYELAVSNIHNLYELIDTQIPLFALYELIKEGAENKDLTQSEYLQAIERTKKACITFYMED